MARVIECDVCIVGAGITAAMVAEKLAAERQARIVVVEAGDHSVPLAERGRHRSRFLGYGENPWPEDHLPGQTALGERVHGFSPSMTVGGLAMHWGAVTPRFSPEDFRVRSLYGVGDDWPLSYEELEPFYQEAEERIGVAGEPGPAELDPREKPYPMPAIPLSYNLGLLKAWGEKADIPFWSAPMGKNTEPYAGRPVCCRNDTCSPICPIGAKYSPDFSFARLVEAGRIELVTRTLVRRLVLEQGSERVEYAEAVDRDRPEEPVHLRARHFVLASGYAWSPHLLLLSAEPRFPDGLANRSGLVGKYLNGHRGVNGYVEVPLELFPGMHTSHSLISKRFMAQGPLERYHRHDLRIWESSYAREPRLRDEAGALLLGDRILEDWRGRIGQGAARLRAYYDVLPDRESALTLDARAKNPWGDPLPRMQFRDSPESRALRPHSEAQIAALFERLARAGGGRVLAVRPGEAQEHTGGGCRMSDDPARGVVDRYGRTHDHENLLVVGAPTMPTASCTNGTLTFSALGLLAAAKLGEEYPERSTT